MHSIERILVPTDGSSHADTAVERAIELAKVLRKPVVAIYVVDHPSFQAFPPESLLVDVSDVIRKEAAHVLEKVRARAARDGVAIQVEIREGHPADEIVRAATQKDLIVIATHGRRGLTRMLLGSVAETVIRHAACPVLVVRHAR